MKKNFGLVWKILVILALIAAPLTYSSVLHTSKTTSGKTFVTIDAVGAVSSADYTYTNPNADIAFALALNALPATGGTLDVLSTGTVQFATPITVTKANVVINGSGIGTAFTAGGVSAPFIASANGLTFENCKFDVAPTMGATTGWLWTNVAVGTTLYTERSPNSSIVDNTISAPTGRTASYVIAASDAPASWLSQADLVVSATGCQTAINTALVNNTSVTFSPGDYGLTGIVMIPNHALIIQGQGHATHFTYDGTFAAFAHTDGVTQFYTDSNVTISDIYIENTTPANTYRGISIGFSDHQPSNITLLRVETKGCALDIEYGTNCTITNCYVHDVSANDAAIRNIYGTGNSVTDNKLANTSCNMGIYSGSNASVIVTGNTVLNHTGSGFTIDNGSSTYPVVTLNHLNGVSNGILSENASAGVITIEDNTIIGNAISAGIGIQVWRTSATPTASIATISGNTISTVLNPIKALDLSSAMISNNNIINSNSGAISALETSAWGTPMLALQILNNICLNCGINSYSYGISVDTGSSGIGDIVFNTVQSSNVATARAIQYVNSHIPHSMAFNSITGFAVNYFDNTGNVVVTAKVMITDLPTSDPGVTGELYNSTGTIKIH